MGKADCIKLVDDFIRRVLVLNCDLKDKIGVPLGLWGYWGYLKEQLEKLAPVAPPPVEEFERNDRGYGGKPGQVYTGD
jgi:hypothetical protein